MDEGAEAGELGLDVVHRRAGPCPRASPPALRRKILQHASVLEHEGDVRTGIRETGRGRHLVGEDLQIEREAVVRETRDVFPTTGSAGRSGRLAKR